MDRLSTYALTLLYLLGVLLSCQAVYGNGKCRGSWATHHACLGANGKRSDPAVEMGAGVSIAESRLLQRLLGGDLPRYSDDSEGIRYQRVPEDSLSREPIKRAGSSSEPNLQNFLREIVARLNKEK